MLDLLSTTRLLQSHGETGTDLSRARASLQAPIRHISGVLRYRGYKKVSSYFIIQYQVKLENRSSRGDVFHYQLSFL